MRSKSRLVAILLLIFTFLSITPTHAAIINVGEDQPPIVIPNVQDVIKIEALRSFATPVPLGDSSPDGRIQLILSSGSLRFLDLESGASEVINGGFGSIPLVAFAAEQTFNQAFVWVNNDNVAFLGVNPNNGVVDLYTINRFNRQRSRTPLLNTQDTLPYLPSPDGSKVLYRVAPTVGAFKTNRYKEIPLSRFAQMRSNPITGKTEYVRQSIRISAVSEKLAIYDVASRRLTPFYDLQNTDSDFKFAWSPDSTKLALKLTTYPNVPESQLIELAKQDALGRLPQAENPFFTGNRVEIFELSGGNIRQYTVNANGGNGEIFADVLWSPDSGTLLTRMHAPSRLKDRPNPLYLIRYQSSSFRFYTADGKLQNSYSNPEVDAPVQFDYYNMAFVSNEEIMLNTVRGTDRPVFVYNRASGELKRLSMPQGSVEYPAIARSSRKVVALYSNFVQPYEIFGMGIDSGEFRQYSDVNRNVKASNNIKVENVNFTLKNGQQRSGLLILPANAAFPPQNLPMLHWQQGGPNIAMLNRYLSRPEDPYTLPNFGYGMLVVPLSGREGYGPEFLNALVEGDSYGKLDIDEAAEIMEQAIAQGWTSRGKTGVVGCSYGGYFAAQSTVRHPQTYTAANPQCTPVDEEAEFRQGSTSVLSAYTFGVTPDEKPERYREASPLFGATNVRSATVLFHGTDDFLPIAAVEDYHNRLSNNGQAVNMYRFDGDGHGLSIDKYAFVAAQLQLDWFRTFLK
jgi:dipeptidyl aminopeptidase/acylaminoacyl peptidase